MKECPTVWSNLRPWTLPPYWFKEKKKIIKNLSTDQMIVIPVLAAPYLFLNQARCLGPTELSLSARLMAGMGRVMYKPRISASLARMHSAGAGWRLCESQWMSLKSRLLLSTVWECEDHTAVTQLLTASWHAAPSQLPSNSFVLAVVVFSNCFPVCLFSSSFSPSHFLLYICCHLFLLSVPWQCFQQVPFSSSVPAPAP